MANLIVAKFGGSVLGLDGISIPEIIKRIINLKKESKIIAVFSAPLTIHNDKKRSLTDVVLEQGRNAENGIVPNLDIVKSTYQKILELVNSENKEDCKKSIDLHLQMAQKALDEALEKKEFVDEVRSRALAFSGEILISHVMNYIIRSNGVKADAVSFDDWPIITDDNIESTNFLTSESRIKMQKIEELVNNNEVVTMRSPNATRPWQHVLEPLSGYLKLGMGLLKQSKKFQSSWNFGPSSSNVQSVQYVVEMIASLWGDQAKWQLDEASNPDEAYYLKLDCSKAQIKLGWSLVWDLETTIQHTVDWFKTYLNTPEIIREKTIGQIEQYFSEIH